LGGRLSCHAGEGLTVRELNVVAMIGSLRRESMNRMLYQAAVELAPVRLRLSEFPIGELPHFNDDLDHDGGPELVRDLRARISAADGILFVTPEYNHSIPGVLKNAIDWASRPSGRAAILGKPATVMGAASGRSGTMRAQGHLRSLFPTLDLRGLNKPEVIVTFATEKFDAEGRLVDEPTREAVTAQLAAFSGWIDQLT
jgi:chromate reductase